MNNLNNKIFKKYFKKKKKKKKSSVYKYKILYTTI